MLHARADESYAGSPRDTPLYVVAAYVGSPSQWWEFDRRWRKSMAVLGIEHVGCHASNVRNGVKPYHDRTPQQRGAIQQRLITDIADSGIFGCIALSEMDGWRKRRDIFSEFLGKDFRKFNEPHLLAHRQCVLLMFHVTENATREPIAFVFDRNSDAGGRAREWYHQTIKSSALPAEERARMGPYSEGERMKTLGLQAADMLAYSAFRNFTGKNSWQWEQLIAPKRVTAMVFGEQYWQDLQTDLAAAKERSEQES